MPSIYRWEGNVEVVNEHQLVIKTMAARVEALKQRLNELHPYDVPEILVSVADAGTEWLRQRSSSRPRSIPGARLIA